MYKIADFQDYRQPPVVPAPAPGWLHSLTDIIESRYHDEDCIQQLLCLIAEQSGLTNVSVALPDAPGRFKAQFCSTGIRNGEYSFAVQHALCRQSQSREWLVIKEGSERPEFFEPQRDSLGLADRCLLVPLVLPQAVVALLVLDLRSRHAQYMDFSLVSFLGGQIAHMLATQVVPNIKTLYARPYQRVKANELDDIQPAIDKCNGNKTMDARVMGLTPRQ